MSGIIEYQNKIKNLLAQSPFILAYKLEEENRGGVIYFVKGAITFTDNSSLHFKEYISFISSAIPKKLAYSYHYQSLDQELIFRYDNAEHHSEIDTYPHHKHLPNMKPVSSIQPDFSEVLFEINLRLKNMLS